MCEAYAPDIEEGGRVLTCAVAPGIAVDGDRELLAQLLANLIENALAHTPPGTAVRVSLRAPDLVDPGPVLEVSDDGPGIPASSATKCSAGSTGWSGAARRRATGWD